MVARRRPATRAGPGSAAAHASATASPTPVSNSELTTTGTPRSAATSAISATATGPADPSRLDDQDVGGPGLQHRAGPRATDVTASSAAIGTPTRDAQRRRVRRAAAGASGCSTYWSANPASVRSRSTAVCEVPRAVDVEPERDLVADRGAHGAQPLDQASPSCPAAAALSLSVRNPAATARPAASTAASVVHRRDRRVHPDDRQPRGPRLRTPARGVQPRPVERGPERPARGPRPGDQRRRRRHARWPPARRAAPRAPGASPASSRTASPQPVRPSSSVTPEQPRLARRPRAGGGLERRAERDADPVDRAARHQAGPAAARARPSARPRANSSAKPQREPRRPREDEVELPRLVEVAHGRAAAGRLSGSVSSGSSSDRRQRRRCRPVGRPAREPGEEQQHRHEVRDAQQRPVLPLGPAPAQHHRQRPLAGRRVGRDVAQVVDHEDRRDQRARRDRRDARTARRTAAPGGRPSRPPPRARRRRTRRPRPARGSRTGTARRCRRGRRRSPARRARAAPSRRRRRGTARRAPARPIVIAMATSSWRSVTRPAAATRIGPWRSGVSAPRRKSDRSLAKLATTWSSSATSTQPSGGVRAERRARRERRAEAHDHAGDGRRERVRPGGEDPDRGAADGRGADAGRRSSGAPRVLAVVGRPLLEERAWSPRGPRRSCSRGPWRCRRTPGARRGRRSRRGTPT